ncbi:MAG: double zinc ribbon domain-containing protein [Acetobacteraceae bacterium]
MAFPPVCLHCKAEILSHNALCATCFAQTERISPPFCHGCAAPLPAAKHLNHNHLCIYCQNSPPPWSAARAAFIFGDVTQSLIFDLKYRDRTEVATFFAHAMMRHGAALLSDADLIAPVLLHWRRLLRRKFNQSPLSRSHCAECIPRGCNACRTC